MTSPNHYPSVVGIIYGRDDSGFLQQALRSMQQQTYPLESIIYVDDASHDDSVAVAEAFGVQVIQLRTRHASWAGTPNLAHLPNIGIRALPAWTDYFLINGADVVLDHDYVEQLLYYAERNLRLVLVSGIIRKEPWSPLVPKGAGRLHQYRWWMRHMRAHPLIAAWESYPIYQALSHGYQTMCLPVTGMRTLRSTRRCKPQWGHAMRELGYMSLRVLLRCVRNLFSRDARTWPCVVMALTYLLSPKRSYNGSVARYLQQMQHVDIQQRQLGASDYPTVFCDKLVAVSPKRMVLCAKQSLVWRSQLDCLYCRENKARR